METKVFGFRWAPVITLVPCVSVLLGSSPGAATAQVISGSQITFAQVGVVAGRYSAITVHYPVPVAPYSETVFAYTTTTLVVTLSTADEEADWYLVSAGDVFSATTIAAAQFPIIFTTDQPRPPVAVPLGDFYLGVNTGTGFTGGRPNRQVFGWLELDNTGTELIPIANAVDYGDGGIIVGTTTGIPEPASLLLLAGALPLLVARRRGR